MPPETSCGVTGAVTEKRNAGRMCRANQAAVRLESWLGKWKKSIGVARRRKPAAVASWAPVTCVCRHSGRNPIWRCRKSWQRRIQEKGDNQGKKKPARKMPRNPRPGMVRSRRLAQCGGGT